DYPTVVSQLQSGTLRGLVTTSKARIETLPDVPTLGETGISKYEAEIFYGIVAPAKTPTDALNRLSGWFSSALKAPDTNPSSPSRDSFRSGCAVPNSALTCAGRSTNIAASFARRTSRSNSSAAWSPQAGHDGARR